MSSIVVWKCPIVIWVNFFSSSCENTCDKCCKSVEYVRWRLMINPIVPEIYQRKFSFVNDVSMMIDVSIATVYSGGVITIFSLFSVFFSVFSPTLLRKRESFTFLCLFWLSLFLRTNSYIFRCRHCQLYDCILEIQDGGSKFKMAALWRHCEVMKRHNWHVITLIC